MLGSRTCRLAVVGVVLGASLLLWPATAGAAKPVVTVSLHHINCGSAPVGGSVSCAQLAIRTDGPQIRLGTNPVDGDSADFGNLDACDNLFVSLGQSCAMNITFGPTETGHRQATLHITDFSTGNELAKVGIVGRGT
jgi:hypothetical protein